MLLHDILFTPGIRRNLLSSLGFKFAFEGSKVDIFLGITYYGSCFISDGLIILDIDYSSSNNVNESFSLIATNDNVCNNSIRLHARLGHIGQR